MATSKCPKCNNTSFELVENSPQKSRFKFMFIQCSSCGSVVGTMDYINIGAVLENLERKIESIESKVNRL